MTNLSIYIQAKNSARLCLEMVSARVINVSTSTIASERALMIVKVFPGRLVGCVQYEPTVDFLMDVQSKPHG